MAATPNGDEGLADAHAVAGAARLEASGHAPTARSRGPEVAAIRGWADALRGGDVEKAAGYWALPVDREPTAARLELRTRAAVRFFNETLPCGAKLESTERESGFVVATFRLTERPGEGRVRHRHRQPRADRVPDPPRQDQAVAARPDPEPASEAPGGSTS